MTGFLYLLLICGPAIGLVLTIKVSVLMGFALWGLWLLLIMFIFGGFWL